MSLGNVLASVGSSVCWSLQTRAASEDSDVVTTVRRALLVELRAKHPSGAPLRSCFGSLQRPAVCEPIPQSSWLGVVSMMTRIRGRHETQCIVHVGCETSSEASTRHELVKILQHARNQKTLSMLPTSLMQRGHIKPQHHYTFFESKIQLVPHFCDIRLASAVPTFSALDFHLSFRRQLRVSIQLVSQCECCNHRAGRWVCRTCPAPRRDASPFGSCAVRAELRSVGS